MKRPPRLLSLALLSAVALPGHNVAAAQRPSVVATADHIRFLMFALADDSMEGRGTGTRGSMRAARFIASQFQSVGLTPAGDSGFFQHVPMVNRIADYAHSNLYIDDFDPKIKHWSLFPLIDYIVAPGRIDPRPIDSVQTIYGGVQGDTANPLTADQVRGKLVIFASASGGRGGRAGAGGARGGRGRGQSPAAQALANALSQAAGTATIVGDNFTVAARFAAQRPGGPIVKDPAAPPQAPTPISLTITTGAAESMLGVPLAQATKGQTGRTMRGKLLFQENPLLGGNVVGIIPGSDPALKNEVVLVDAHYDHLGIRTPTPPATDSIYNGADDDASGTTAVIEIARAMKAGPPPKRTLILIATTGEEVGLLGTNWYIAHPVRPLSQMAANLEIEMIDRPDSLAGGSGRAWLTGYERSTMGEMFAAAGLPIVPDKRPEQQFFQRSDNIAFARAGIPAHTLSTFDLHADYHQTTDKLALANFDHMAGVINAAIGAVRLLTDGPRPEWHPGGKP